MNNNQNMYDMNIENSRVAQDMNSLNQNPYVNNQQLPNTQVPNNAVNPNANNGLLDGFNNGDFIKGALIGAAVTYLLTNKGAQENIMKAVAKGSEFFQAGMEEMKERMEDAKAAMEAQNHNG